MADSVLRASASKRVQRMLAMSRGGIRRLTAVFVVSWGVRARLGVFWRRFDGCREGSWRSWEWFWGSAVRPGRFDAVLGWISRCVRVLGVSMDGFGMVLGWISGCVRVLGVSLERLGGDF